MTAKTKCKDIFITIFMLLMFFFSVAGSNAAMIRTELPDIYTPNEPGSLTFDVYFDSWNIPDVMEYRLSFELFGPQGLRFSDHDDCLGYFDQNYIFSGYASGGSAGSPGNLPQNTFYLNSRCDEGVDPTGKLLVRLWIDYPSMPSGSIIEMALFNDFIANEAMSENGSIEPIDAILGKTTIFVKASVPIPSAVWLLGSGLIGLVGFRRKFKKA